MGQLLRCGEYGETYSITTTKWARSFTLFSAGLRHRDHPLQRDDFARFLRAGLDRVVFDGRLAHAIRVVVGGEGAVPFLVPADDVHQETLGTDPVVEPAETDVGGGGARRHLGVVALPRLDAEHAEVVRHLGELFLAADGPMTGHDHVNVPAGDLVARLDPFRDVA